MGMMAVGIGHYLFVSAILLVLGVFGIFLNRKNVIIIMMSIELIQITFHARIDHLLLEWRDRAGVGHIRRELAQTHNLSSHWS